MLPFHDPEMRFRSAPRLETERLVLREFQLDDLEFFLATYSDEDMTRFVGGTIDSENSWRKLLTVAALWSLTGIGMWSVERNDDGRTIGYVGFFDFFRPMEPSIVGEVEMGWVIGSDGQGKGLASEACGAALDWFDTHFPATPVYALISPGNDPSMRVAEKLSFVRKPDRSYRERPQTVWLRG